MKLCILNSPILFLLSPSLLFTNTVEYARAFTTPFRDVVRNKIRAKSIHMKMVNESSTTIPFNNDKNPFTSLMNMFQNKKSTSNTSSSRNRSTKIQEIVKSFINALNSCKDPAELIQFYEEDVNFVDDAFYNPIIGQDALLRHFYLHAGSSSPLSTSLLGSKKKDRGRSIAIDDMAAGVENSDEDGDTVGNVFVLYHLEDVEGIAVPYSQGITYYAINIEDEKIKSVFDVHEPPSPKPGDGGLQLLKTLSQFLEKDSDDNNNVDIEKKKENVYIPKSETSTAVDTYFTAWNRRNMDQALDSFTQDCTLRDTQYEGAFNGKKEVQKHLNNVKDCLPNSFRFVLDEVVTMPSPQPGIKDKIGALWHVENDGDELAFTRGCSFYTTDAKTGLIQTGIEIPEKAPPKQGVINSVRSMFDAEPVRYIPIVAWIAYIIVVFFSNGILPGANALQLEERTWIEVRDLSINFFLVSPLLHLPISPTVHPMLEGVFNLLLSWAAMFAGFLSDDRMKKPNLLPFVPIVIGMQFLTSAFLLPYLALRSEERDTTDMIVYMDDVGVVQAAVSEWRPLGAFLGTVGTGAIVWSFIGRAEFGDFSQRYSSFLDLLSIDRVGSSFIVDLAIFALFQSWFIDDDLQRRGVNVDDLVALRYIAKFVPFFGLAAYLSLRPELPCRE